MTHRRLACAIGAATVLVGWIAPCAAQSVALGLTSEVNGEGLLVTHVHATSPAAKAGLRAGDVLLEIDGDSMAPAGSLSTVLDRHGDLDRVEIVYRRDGRLQRTTAELMNAVDVFWRGCDAGDGEACYSAGMRLRGGFGFTSDPAKAHMLLERGCSWGANSACLGLGRMLRGGEGIRADPARAAALFQRLCDGDHPEGCHDLSLQYRSGSGVPRDVERAAVLLKQACDRGDSDACPQRRLFAAVRPKPGTPRDPSCGGSYRLDGYGLFSFSKDVSTEQGCASVGMEDVQAACRMNHAAAGTKATAMYRFRRGVVDVTKGFIAKCR